jgi:hypothetical protein
MWGLVFKYYGYQSPTREGNRPASNIEQVNHSTGIPASTCQRFNTRLDFCFGVRRPPAHWSSRLPLLRARQSSRLSSWERRVSEQNYSGTSRPTGPREMIGMPQSAIASSSFSSAGHEMVGVLRL